MQNNKKKKTIVIASMILLLSTISLQAKEIEPFKISQLEESGPSERIKITGIEVVGSDRKASIEIAMYVRAGDTVSPTQIREDLQRIFGLGYFADVNASKEKNLDGYKLIIIVKENPELKEVKVSGNTIIKTEEINKFFEQQKDKVINLNDLKSSIERSKALYSAKGYQAISFIPNLDPKGILDLKINEGVIESINIVGNKETKTKIIKREIRQKPGDVFNIKIMREDLRRVFNTNYFENVDIKPKAGKENPNHIALDIIIKEKSTGSINLGAGYNTRDGIVGTFSIAKDNLFGNGQRLKLDLQVGNGFLSQLGGSTGSGSLGSLEWYDPWFMPQLFPPRTGFGFSVYKSRQANFFQTADRFKVDLNSGVAERGYSLINDRTGFSLSASRAILGDPLTTPWRLGFTVRSEAITPVIPRVQDIAITTPDNKTLYVTDLEKTNTNEAREDINKLNTEFDSFVKDNIKRDLTVSRTGVDNRVSMNMSLSYDTRDFAADPRSGWNNVFSIEPSLGDIRFLKISTTVNKYIPIPSFGPFQRWTFALGGRLGMLTGDKIALYERFYSGGFDTIRGWPEAGFLSGENVFIGSAEIRFPIYNPVSGVFFYDVGNFWNQNWQVTNQNVSGSTTNGTINDQSLLNPFLRSGFGFGIRLNTPLGAIRADYGIRDITRPFDFQKGAQFHFNIGQKF